MSHMALAGRPSVFELTSAQLRDAVLLTEGVRLPQRTQAGWAKQRILVPSIRWDGLDVGADGKLPTGKFPKGRYHAAKFSLDDLVRARFIVRLRKIVKWSPARVREVLADPLLQRALRAKSDAQIVITGDRVLVQFAGDSNPVIEAGRGQFVFRFAAVELLTGNEEAVRRVLQAA